MAWMPLNNHPTVKPTYDFWTTTNWDAATGTGRTAISNGRLVGFTDNATDPSSRSARRRPGRRLAHLALEVAGADRELPGREQRRQLRR